MENQPIIDSQNTQRIGQNPVNQPVQIPEKPKVNYWMISTIILSVGLALTAFYILNLRNKLTVDNQQPVTNNSIPTATPNSTTSSPTLEPITTPEENTLYLGTYNNVDAIFLTDKEKQKYFDPGAVPKTSPNIGELQMSGGVGYTPFDFKKLIKPRKVYSSNTKIHSVNSFKLNNAKSEAYVVLNYGNEVNGSYPGLTNKIIQIKLDTLSANEMWSNEVGSKKYEGAGGVAYMDTIADDKYITFQLGGCYACEGGPVGTVILNLSTKNEKYYRDIGNIQFNIANKTFSYQRLAPFQEPCDPSPGCDNGQRTIYKPSGQVYTENLP